jgi:plasmid stabilization system protein ParE
MACVAGVIRPRARSPTIDTHEETPMPQKAWSDKRERQYEHIKDSYEDRGVSEDEAEERAARTVNKERREAGETKQQRSRAR